MTALAAILGLVGALALGVVVGIAVAALWGATEWLVAELDAAIGGEL